VDWSLEERTHTSFSSMRMEQVEYTMTAPPEE
jgi:hypothetical protein